MHSRCMDAADKKSVKPIKEPLIAALHGPLVIEMSACILRPAHRIWHWENKWRVPQERDPTEKLCPQLFPVEAEGGNEQWKWQSLII